MDVEGRQSRFLSAYSAVSGGHHNQRIIKAMNDQLIKSTSRCVFIPILGEYAEKLCAFTGMDKMLPMNTGAEAVENSYQSRSPLGIPL